jgi:uncharacterized OB-fold protein
MTGKLNFLLPTNLESPGAVPFWQGLQTGKFLAPRCRSCGELFFPPRSHCPECLEDSFTWEELSGKGILYSWTELFFAEPEFDTPFLLGLIDLAEGTGRITARISQDKTEELYIGMPVLIKILRHNDGIAIYYAEPARAEKAAI